MQCYLMCLLATCCIIGAQGSQSCNRFGNDLVMTTAAPTGSRSGTFVNIPTAISCPGNATQWDVCYYSSNTATLSTTNFGVYRLSTGTIYILITASQASFTIPKNASAYACSRFAISPQYVVQPGDILVVCVQAGGGATARLGVAGTATTSILLNTAGCSGLPGATLDTSTYSTVSGLTLHVSLSVNECAVSNGGCEQICTDITLGNNCSCYSGYSLDANLKNCTDINECLINNGSCSQICNNTNGSYYCSCNSGFQLTVNNRTCNDTNECSNFNGNCSQICTNTVGSYLCTCNSGYSLAADGKTCNDINECLTNNGSCSQICINTNGSYYCSCNSGFQLSVDKRTCNDTNECQTSNGNCSQNCINTIGNYFCTCNSGYSLAADSKTCNDINECSIYNGNCSQMCTNIIGSYVCSCNNGYQLDVDNRTCTDINECLTSNGGCTQICTNTIGAIGGYFCSCSIGFQLASDNSTCNDINECLIQNGDCDQVCTNTIGSFLCSCIAGYSLDADLKTCNDIDECSNTNMCGQVCRNTVGSYVCSCVSEYTLGTNNMTCTYYAAETKGGTTSYVVIGIFLVVIAILIIVEAVYLYKKKCFKKHKALEATNGIALSSLIYANSETIADVKSHNNAQLALDNVIYETTEVETTNLGTGHNESSTPAQQYGNFASTNEIQLYDIYADPNSPSEKPATHSNIADTSYYATTEAMYDAPKPNQHTYSALEEALAVKPQEESPYYRPASDEHQLYMQIQNQRIQNIPLREIEIKNQIGKGQFGAVSIGMWKRKKSPHIEVAIKTLSDKSSPDDKVKFLQEAAIMAQFRHPNVVQLYGIVSEGLEVMLVIELAQKGDLRNHLNSLRSDSKQLEKPDVPRQLLSFSKHIAHAMQYLSNKSFVHRDLAARNILIVMKDKELICKIADFGLSRDLADESYYVSKGGMVPVKWTAPEAVLYKKYSIASDVWSYGCLLYEIWSVGHKPFEGRTNAEAIEKVDAGYRLPPPPGCPLHIYKTMIECWNPNAKLRPQFRDIYLSLCQYDEHVLNIPNEALKTHPKSGVLGAVLEAGQDMYIDLQTMYKA